MCWVKEGNDVRKRRLKLGDTNDEFTIVLDGLAEGDEVVLNPLAFVDEAQMQVLRSEEPAEDLDSEAETSPQSGMQLDRDKTKPKTKSSK